MKLLRLGFEKAYTIVRNQLPALMMEAWRQVVGVLANAREMSIGRMGEGEGSSR
jgi:hypothetical protein